MFVRANFVDIYLRGMCDRSIQSETELAREIKLTVWSIAGNLSNRSSGVQIPRDICTCLKRYLYSAKCSWIINTHIANVKEYRRPGYLPNLGPLNFSVRRFLWGNFKAPHKQRFGFCDSSLFLYATRHLHRHFCKTLHMLRSDKQTCGHDLKVWGKKASKYKSEQNFSHIKKLLIAYEILVW